MADGIDAGLEEVAGAGDEFADLGADPCDKENAGDGEGEDVHEGAIELVVGCGVEDVGAEPEEGESYGGEKRADPDGGELKEVEGHVDDGVLAPGHAISEAFWVLMCGRS